MSHIRKDQPVRQRCVTPRRGRVGGAVVAMLVVALCAGCGGGSKHPTAHGTFTILGGAFVRQPNNSCAPAGDLVDLDLSAGTQVVAYSASGTVLGSGTVSAGGYVTGPLPGTTQPNYPRCVYSTSFPLSRSSTNYEIQVGTQPKAVVQDITDFALSIGGS
jgi:hypothetical protein